MARKAEPGIDFYRVDCSHIRNKKVRLLHNDHGPEGYWIWQCVLATSYETSGYYFDLNDTDALELFASDVCKCSLECLHKIIEGCLRRFLFDQAIYDKYNVLTSVMMQDNYLTATAERRRKNTEIELEQELLLATITEKDKGVKIVPRKNPILPGKFREESNNSGDVPRKNPHSTVEYSRVEDSTEEQSPNGDSPSSPEEDAQKVLMKEYSSLPKDKKTLNDFIASRRPAFLEPYIAMWNLLAEHIKLPLVKTPNKKRRQKIATRLKESGFDFLQILRKVNQCNDHTRTWINFNWIIESEDNYTKLLEGNYDRKDSIPIDRSNGSSVGDQIKNARLNLSYQN